MPDAASLLLWFRACFSLGSEGWGGGGGGFGFVRYIWCGSGFAGLVSEVFAHREGGRGVGMLTKFFFFCVDSYYYTRWRGVVNLP